MVATNCGYAVCAGIECERWHAAVDQGALEAGRFLMTTWHEDEGNDDVTHLFVRNTFDQSYREFSRFLVLILGGNSARAEALASMVRRYATGTEPC